jgi:DHA2 family multidrug resistance protein-like MFS transporter
MGSLLNAGYRSKIGGFEAGLPPELAPVVRDGINSAQHAATALPTDAADGVLDAARSAFVDGWALSMWAGAAALVLAGIATFWLFQRADRSSGGAQRIV